MTIDEFLQRLEDVTNKSNGGWKAKCPAHDDRQASLSIDVVDDRILLKCFGPGCTAQEITTAMGLSTKDLYLGERSAPAPRGKKKVVATYDYRDASGKLLYQSVRYEPKDFRQRRPKGDGEWDWSVKGVPKVPYRLPDLVRTVRPGSNRVYFVEGEKDADRLWSLGLPATCNEGGAGKWTKSHTDALLAALPCPIEVVIIPDNDEAGLKHRDVVGSSLKGKAARIQVLELPGLPPKGDVSDWLNAGHTVDELQALADQAPEWTPAREPKTRPRPSKRGDDDSKPSPAEIGTALLQHHHFIFVWERLWIYRDGCYRQDGELVARAVVQEILGDDARKRDGDEVVYWLSNACRVDPANVNAGNLVNVQNGLLDPLTGTLEPHRPDYLSTIQLPVTWSPDAYHERLDQFLDEVLPSKETRLLLEEAAGYALLPDCRFEKSTMLTGEGSNGKSVTLDVLTRMLGSENVSGVKLQDLGGNRFKAAELVGKLANVYADLPREALEETDVFKTLVSGDRVSAERKFGHPFEFTNRAKLFFSANELPRTKDRTPAFFRRWIIIPFPYSFTPGGARKPDPTLRQKLTTPEALAYMLHLSVEGLRRLLERGHFTDTPETQAALDEYRRESDSVLSFVDEACELDPAAEEPKQLLYGAYRRWCDLNGLKPVSKVHAGRSLSGKGIVDAKGGARDSRVPIWRGIRLVDQTLIPGDAPPPPDDEDVPPLLGAQKRQATPRYESVLRQAFFERKKAAGDDL